MGDRSVVACPDHFHAEQERGEGTFLRPSAPGSRPGYCVTFQHISPRLVEKENIAASATCRPLHQAVRT